MMKIRLLYYKILYHLRAFQRKHHIFLGIKEFGADRTFFTREQRDELLIDALTKHKPFLTGKFGGTEMFVMRTVEFNDKKNKEKACKQLCQWSGFFPDNVHLLKKFNQIMKETAREIDLLEKWDKPCEDYFIKKYCKSMKGFCSVPLYMGEKAPWTKHLRGKRVLVISPFEYSIRKQYERRTKLFRDPDVLPEFELQTIKAVQTLGDEEDTRFKTWFEALSFMCQQVDELEFDIALIGCGAYGLPLGAYIKKKGKIAIHMGGGLQLMFGIWGKRWEEKPEIRALKNEYWIRPSEEEQIKGMEKVEGGCYW